MAIFKFPRLFSFVAMTLLAASAVVSAAQPQRLSLADFEARAKRGERLSVVFFGGSLTWGAQASDPQLVSYRALMGKKLEAAYPKAHFTFWDGAIGGTGSQLGAFRLLRDVLSRKPDLVFLDFTVNDDPGQVVPDRLASYESLVRRMLQAGVPVVQVILPVMKDTQPNPPARPLDAKHKEIAAAYGLPVADAVAFVKAEVQAGKTTPEKLWSVPPDSTHPGDAGYFLYAECVSAAFQKAVSDGAVCKLPEKMLYPDTYMTVERLRISGLGTLPEGWKPGAPSRIAITYDFLPSRWLDDEVVASLAKENGTMPRPLRFRVRAQNVMLFGETTPATGDYEVAIDGGAPKLYHAGQMAISGNLRYVQMIAEGLDPAREHVIEITPRLQPGQELRLESLCLAGAPATGSY